MVKYAFRYQKRDPKRMICRYCYARQYSRKEQQQQSEHRHRDFLKSFHFDPVFNGFSDSVSERVKQFWSQSLNP